MMGNATVTTMAARPPLALVSRRSRRKTAVGSRDAVRTAIALLSYAFLHDNAATLPGTLGYGWTRLIALPAEVRFIEVVVIVGLALSVVMARRSVMTVSLLGGCLLFVGLSILSYLNHPVTGPIDFGRLVYMYLLPIVVFVIARELRWDPAGVRTVVRFVLGWVLISAAASWLQYLYLGYPAGDDITGLNPDAHVNVSLLLIGSLLLLADGLFLRQWFRILPAIGLAATAVLPSELKILFISPLLVAMVLWYYSGGSLWRHARMMFKRAVVVVPLLAAIVSVGFIAFNRIDILSSNRVPALIDRALNDPLNFGTVIAYRNAVTILTQGPRNFLLGLGPYAYSNPISMGQSREDGALGRFTRSDLASSAGESGEDARITLATSLALEFGVPAFMMLGCLYLFVLIETHLAAVRSRDGTVRRYAAVAVPGVMILLAAGTLGLFGSLSALALSWPVMILAGATCRLEARNRVLAKRHRQQRRRRPGQSAQGGV
ncbi:MAG: hypothetical protein ABI868_07600 [Acidobacteriota bacterium]